MNLGNVNLADFIWFINKRTLTEEIESQFFKESSAEQKRIGLMQNKTKCNILSKEFKASSSTFLVARQNQYSDSN